MKKLLIGILVGFGCASAYADTKISAMTSSTTLNSGDVIPFVANPTGTPLNRIITKTNLSSTLDILTNSSGTATYLQQSSATATYLQKSSATATYQLIGPYLTGNQTITVSGDASGSGTTSIPLTNAALQNNITTFGSSITVTNGGGIKNTYGIITSSVSASSMTLSGQMVVSSETVNGQLVAGTYQGGGLTTCGDTTHALSWSSGSFGCQSITGTGGGGGASSLAVTIGVSRSSPTSDVIFDPNQFTGTISASSITVALNSSSVTLQGNNLGATYLTNSSATATYLMSSSATATYLNQLNASSTYLTQSSATATYGQLNSSNTWTGSNFYTSGISASSITLTGSQGLGVTYGITAGSVTTPGITVSTEIVNNYIQTSFIAGKPDPITSSGTIYMKPDLRYGGNVYLADDPNPLLGDPAGTGVTILQTQCSSDKTAYCNSNFDLVFASSGVPIVNKSMYELGAEGYFDSTGTFVSSTTLPLGYHGYFWDYTNTATVWDATPNKHFQSYYDFYALGNMFVSSTTAFNGNINISSGVLLNGAAGTNGQVFTSQGAGTIPHWTTIAGGAGTKAPITFTWDGGGIVISSSVNSLARFTQVPYSITITSSVISCSVTSAFTVGTSTFSVTVSSQTNASFNGSNGYTSICASDCPSLSSQARKGDSALTGWSTSFSAGDYLWADLNAVPQAAMYCQLQLWVQ